MSVASDFEPRFVIPERARRTSRSMRAVRDVDGNVIAPIVFRAPLDDERETAAGPGDASVEFGVSTPRLRVLTAPSAWSAPSLYRARPLVAPLAISSVGAIRQTSRPSAPPASRSASVRLTAHGRVVLSAMAAHAALGVVLGAWLSVPSSAPTPAAVPAQVVVHDGDTLWSIAARVAPGQDPRRAVDRLRDVNGLTSVSLVPGQVLRAVADPGASVLNSDPVTQVVLVGVALCLCLRKPGARSTFIHYM